MGTRSGDMDPAVIFHLMRVGGMSADEIDTLLNKRSGLIGLCGDNDMREIRRRVDAGDERARLAFDIYIHRLKSTSAPITPFSDGWTPWPSRPGSGRTRRRCGRPRWRAWRGSAWRSTAD